MAAVPNSPNVSQARLVMHDVRAFPVTDFRTIAEIRDRTKAVGGKAVAKVEGFFDEFKKFINRGNVVDLAVGIIVGAAFGAIVQSLVNDIFSPIIGLAGHAALGDLFIIMRYGNESDSASCATYPTVQKAKEAGAITLNYGNFINSIINFLIVSSALFLFIKVIFLFKRKEAAKKPSTDWPCPKCRELVKEGAIRCPHCTAEPIADLRKYVDDGHERDEPLLAKVLFPDDDSSVVGFHRI